MAGRKAYLDRSYMEDQYIKKWLTGLAKNTKRAYGMGIKEWLDFIDMTPTEQIKQRIQDTISQDLTQRTFFEDKWRLYKEFLEKQGTSPATVQSKLKVVASFFSRNSVKLNLKRGDWQSTQKQDVIKKKWVPTNEELRRMYGHANLRDRAMLLVLYQSGFSQIDVANLKIEQLDGILDNPETEHYFIEKPREKTGNVQATCLSFEAVHDIKAMLNEREEQTGYLFVSTTKGKGTKLTTRTINEAMYALAVRTFGEKLVKEREFKAKNLRQSYNSALLRANIQPQEIKDVMMGHKRQGARGSYAYDAVTIKENYHKAFKYMTINGIQTKRDLAELRQASLTNAKMLTELSEENKQLKQDMVKLAKELIKIHELLEPVKDFGRDLTPEESKKSDLELIDIGINPFTNEDIKTPEEAEQLRKKVNES